MKEKKAQPDAEVPAEAERGKTGVREMTIATLEPELRTKPERPGSGIEFIPSPRRMRAVGYVRQGFGETEKKWTSPEGQKARVAACADAHGWHLLHTYEDIGWTGQDLDRPGLLALLARLDFEILVLDRTDRLTCKKKDLTFLLALLEEHGITCVPATWSWEPLAQYMRWWYRLRGSAVYASLEPEAAKGSASASKGRSLAGVA
jgi:hypothetical protein